MGKILKDLQRHLMTATSYMILFVVPGGIYFALSVMMNGKGAVPTEGIAAQLNQIGSAGLALFIPALGGYIAYSIAEKAGIGPGFIGAYLAREIGAGFIGGIIAGFIAGYVVEALKKIKLPTAYKSSRKYLPLSIIRNLGFWWCHRILLRKTNRCIYELDDRITKWYVWSSKNTSRIIIRSYDRC